MLKNETAINGLITSDQNSSEPTVSRAYRLNAQRLFLTYPQCTIEPTDALNQLTTIIATKNATITDYIIA